NELQRAAGVELSYELARKVGWLVDKPERGDLVCFQWDTGALDHIGFVVEPLADGSVKTVEGNCHADGGTGHAAGEGDGVYLHVRPRRVCAAFIRVPGQVRAPEAAAGYAEWARWCRGGRAGKRPSVPEKVPDAWWAKLGEELHAKHS